MLILDLEIIQALKDINEETVKRESLIDFMKHLGVGYEINPDTDIEVTVDSYLNQLNE